MKIVHIINKKNPINCILDLVEAQRTAHEVELIDLDAGEPDYDSVVEKVMACDRVISWQNIHSEGG